MRTVLILNLDPLLGDIFDLTQVLKNMGAEFFMMLSAVKAFNKGIFEVLLVR